MLRKICGLAILSLFVCNCLAAQRIVLLALTKDKAIVSVDGHHRLISVGKTSPDGLTLIESTSQKAVISVNGKTQTLALGSGVSMYDSEQKTQKKEVLVTKDSHGTFSTQVTINGTNTAEAIIDTGASAVAMNRATAERLHLNLNSGQQHTVETAGGKVNSQEINIDSIKVGSIELHNVKALVVDSSMDDYVLLGMTFLSRLKMTNNPNHVLLEYSGQR